MSSASHPFKVNLFIIGAMKCGTSALHHMLSQHPCISMSREKEPAHFIAPDDRKFADKFVENWSEPEAYHALFQQADGIRYYGESTQRYSHRELFPGVPERIHAYNPESRFIYLVREPVSRIISHYLQGYRVGMFKEPLLQAVKTRPMLFEKSDYGKQIAAFTNVFPRENIKILVSERLRKDPARYLRELHEWLELDYVPALDKGNHAADNVTPSRVGKPRRLFASVNADVQRTKIWRRASKGAPAWLKESLRPLLYSNIIPPDELPRDELVTLLADDLARIRNEVAELLHDPLPEWDNPGK